mmetsp:Transcript_19405/g.26845  ORF Transcript_19405/g.26845 Transcript_19405/m.26845 type:complete len:184 (+) Transcript_19405:110-661(+)
MVVYKYVCAFVGALSLLELHSSSQELSSHISKSGYNLDMTTKEYDRVVSQLTPLQRNVTLENDTEVPFDNEYWDNHESGVYVSRIGGLPLFTSKAKFESGTGWPSFYEPFDPEHVREVTDKSWWIRRTEVVDARSGAHLGHVFNDGPKPTGLRYCVNSAALKFISDKEELPVESKPLETYKDL